MIYYYEEESPAVVAIRQIARVVRPQIRMRMEWPAVDDCYFLLTLGKLHAVAGDVADSQMLACFRARTRLRAVLLLIGSSHTACHDRWTMSVTQLVDVLALPRYPQGLSDEEFRIVTTEAIDAVVSHLQRDIQHHIRRGKGTTAILMSRCEAACRLASDRRLPSPIAEALGRAREALEEPNLCAAAASLRESALLLRSLRRREDERV